VTSMTSAADLYADAGVDVAAGERAVDLMRASIATTARPELIGGIFGKCQQPRRCERCQ